ncbi:Protein CLEC-53 [Aphelenchoides avenae]|nr:Protein CLEC-53 [Aphelenchus avenae]
MSTALSKSNASLNFGEARAVCQALGSDLISIHSLQEQTLAYMLTIGQDGCTSNEGTVEEGICTEANTTVWIGLMRSTLSSTWKWIDESPYNFTYFSLGTLA